MSNKNIAALTAATLLGLSAQIQAEDSLEYASLGTGQEIRGEVAVQTDDPPETPSAQQTPQTKKTTPQKKASTEEENPGDKSTEGKCGEGSCS